VYAGRTGRAGRPGKAITFYTEDDIVNLRRYVGGLNLRAVETIWIRGPNN